MTRDSDAMLARKAEGFEPRRGGSAGRQASPNEAHRSAIYSSLILNLTGNLKGGNV